MDLVVHQTAQWQGMQLDLITVLLHLLMVLQGDNWNDLLKEVVTFSSVEEFWGIYVSSTPALPLDGP